MLKIILLFITTLCFADFTGSYYSISNDSKSFTAWAFNPTDDDRIILKSTIYFIINKKAIQEISKEYYIFFDDECLFFFDLNMLYVKFVEYRFNDENFYIIDGFQTTYFIQSK